MAAGDGKYCTLNFFKQVLIGTTTDPNNPTVYNGNVTGTPDDAFLTACIIDAEAKFEELTGSQFDQVAYNTNVNGFNPFVDVNGFLHVFARERGPVTAVTSLQYRDIMFGASTQWQTVTWNSPDDIILPSFSVSDTHPLPESWHVQIWPNPQIDPRAQGQILVRWQYTGGYATIPSSLSTIIARMAQYIYKLREVPAGMVINQPLGTMRVPSNFPPDIQKAITLWTPVYG